MEKTHIFNLRTEFKYCAAVIRFIEEKEKIIEEMNKTKFILRRTLKLKDQSILYVEIIPPKTISNDYSIVKKWNEFLFEATGKTSKERKKEFGKIARPK